MSIRKALIKEEREYLKKYGKEYKLKHKREDTDQPEWVIICQQGQIYLNNPKTKQLIYHSDINHTRRWVNSRIKRIAPFIEEKSPRIAFSVICDDSFSLMFDEDLIQELEKVLKIRKRKKFSERHKQVLRNNILLYGSHSKHRKSNETKWAQLKP